MEKEFDDIITLDNEEYVVVDEMFYEGVKYLYIISMEDQDKISILKETFENGEPYIESVDKDKLELFMSIFAKRFMEGTKESN